MKHTHALAIHYIVLVAMLALGMAGFFYVSPNHQLQLAIGVATSIGYVLWGILHHTAKGELHRKIVIEYVLIGAIAIILLLTLMGP